MPILTALSNRIGDVILLIAIAWILNYGRWNYIFYMELMKNDLSIIIIGGLVILAAITKRAQIPFSSWLPAAIAAPTPVSALVHSSTLVTAGVFLLIRFNILFTDTFLRKILLLIGGLTIFIAGISANFEFDLKKIIALSTLSQLGLMIRILAIGFPKLAFFHLLTHALFKALLFICAGAIIHNIKKFSRYSGYRGFRKVNTFYDFLFKCFKFSIMWNTFFSWILFERLNFRDSNIKPTEYFFFFFIFLFYRANCLLFFSFNFLFSFRGL